MKFWAHGRARIWTAKRFQLSVPIHDEAPEFRMALDIETLLKSFGDGAPCGEDLEYDPDFISLELAAMPKEEQQIGKSIIPAEEPDYKEVRSTALKVLAKSKDLRAAVFLGNAVLHLEGVLGFERVLAYIRGCAEQYWDSFHPQLDADDDNDPTARVNAAIGLVDPELTLKALRLTPLTDSRMMGRFGLRDIQIGKGEAQAPKGMDQVPDRARISAAFQDTDPEKLAATMTAVKSARAHVKAIEKVFDDKVGAMGPDLSPLTKMLQDMENGLTEFAATLIAQGGGSEDAEQEQAADASDDGGANGGADPADGTERPAAAGAPRGLGAITSSKDVLQALDRICEYYSKFEPSSPVPLFLKRARRLVSADFESIMRDIAPQGLDQVKVLRGPEDGGA